METTVLAVRKETPDTVTLRVHADMTVTPGQFVMLGAPLLAPLPVPLPAAPGAVSLEKRELRRSYSVAGYCAPHRHHEGREHPIGEGAHEHLGMGGWVEVTIKEQSRGVFSRYAQTLTVGDSLQLYGPFGKHFVWDPVHHDHDEHLVWVAGGTGIAPFRCMVQAAVEAGYAGKITLLFSVKTAADVIYRDELAAWQRSLPGLRVMVSLTRPTESDIASWTGLFGRIGEKHLKDAMGGDVYGSRFYVCGPTAMVVGVQATLERLVVPSEKIIVEKYGAIEG